ncbi:glutamate-1-semialdehyde 2,1-aminomutase [Sporothrix brasiliensis 5110]|uniref:Glutamate-1-semialdehyde 2,1-aminomutase n=1 Tax=Sporothrix brasiliensis 5110 TaxID=1398154 RepID=A0A0C2FGS9_9PEZI|nr:glutamate-1-semialdehyde 2,1-aminomutase [Sporothrix brasiliensis 5110]KIH90278.1 glutamate-1-semialdehyde 2,1-aminomutase [Sporothrix brasiliensis 5110]
MAPGAVLETAAVIPSVTAGRLKTDVATATVTVEEKTTPLTAQDALDAAIRRYTAANPRSYALHQLATESMPGGNTRTQLHTAPFPLCMQSGQDYQLTSEDGATYTDFVGELTAAVYGHSHPVIVASLLKTVTTVGLNLGATIAQEHVHASAMCARFGLERVRFTNCGTEANLHALAGARAFTGKRKVVVFAGGYHGGVFMFGGGQPAANNVDRDDFVVARYNDVASAQAAIAQEGVAAVLVEGMQGGPGAVPGTRAFLTGIEAAAKEAGVVFILDEVMTSRVAPGGIAELHDLHPDMKTFGKYLGGGLAFGAFGGRSDIMASYDPRPQPLPTKTTAAGSPAAPFLTHHGTFNNNTLAMYVGHAGLTEVYTPEVCTAFNAQGTDLLRQLAAVTAGTKMCFTGVGTVLGSHFTAAGLQTIERETAEDWTLKELFWFEMMEDGFWTTRRGSIALCLGTPASELQRFVACVAAFLKRHAPLVAVDAK